MRVGRPEAGRGRRGTGEDSPSTCALSWSGLCPCACSGDSGHGDIPRVPGDTRSRGAAERRGPRCREPPVIEEGPHGEPTVWESVIKGSPHCTVPH